MLNSVGHSSVKLPVIQTWKPPVLKVAGTDSNENKSFSSHLRVINSKEMSFADKAQFANAPRGSFVDILV